MPVTQEAVLALVSGVPLAILGGLLLVVRPWRALPVFFGLFALPWGLQIVTANASRMVDDPAVVRMLLNISDALLILAWFYLMRFAAVAIGGLAGRLLTWGGALLASTGLVLVVQRYDLFVPLVSQQGEGTSATVGPAVLWLLVLPFLIALYATILAFYRRYRAARPGTPRYRERGILVAVVMFSSYYTIRNLFFFFAPAATTTVSKTTAASLISAYVVGAVLLIALFVHLVVRPPRPEERDRWLLGAFLVPAASAVLEAFSGAWLPSGATLGLWRLLMVAVLVHALARYQLFDLDLKLHWTVRRGSVVAAFVTVFLLVNWGASSLIHASVGPYVGIAAVGLLLFAVGPVQRLAENLAGMALPGVGRTPDYVAFRKLEVYRAALQDAIRGSEVAASERASLERLREKLGVRPSDAHALEADLLARRGPAPRAAPSPTLPPIEPGALLAGRYRVHRLLGQGAHGRAYLAYDEQGQEEVAVKAVGTTVYGGRAAAALLREARLVASIRHPNVLRVREVLEGAHEAAIVMDYADAGNLHQLLARRGRLSIDEAADVLDQVLAGLDAAHAVGIVHRDIKPENLLMHKDGRVVVADFGVARELRADATGLDGGAVGTLLYMSPEQVRGLTVDARSDLYTAGVLFHQLLTGHFYLPLAGRDDFQVRQLILSAAPQLTLTDRPSWVVPFLEMALAKDPAERFADAQAMRRALLQAMDWAKLPGTRKESVLHAPAAVASR